MHLYFLSLVSLSVMRIVRFFEGVLAGVLYFFHLVELSSQVIGMNEILPGVVFPNMAAVVLISV